MEKEADRSTQGQQQAQDTLRGTWCRDVNVAMGNRGEGQVSRAHDEMAAVVAQRHSP